MERIWLEVKDEHASLLQSGVTHLRQDNFISDFKINVGGEYFPAHKAILASTSIFFRGLFTHDMEVLKKGYVEMKDVTFEGIHQSLEFMYSGTAHVDMSNVEVVAHAAEMLQLRGLSRLCSSFLNSNLTLENCLVTKSLADLYNWKDLKVITERFILDNFESLRSSDLVTSLDVENLKLCLKSLDLDHTASWRIIIDWIKTSPQDRHGELLGLGEEIGMERFPLNFLLDTVLMEPLVMRMLSVMDFIANCLFGDILKLKSSLTTKNCFGLKEILCECKPPNTEEANMAILHFLMENFDSIIENDGWEDLSLEEVRVLCGSADTKCSSEMTRWNLIIGWVKYKQERKKFFPELFQLVQLRRLPLDFLEAYVECEQLVKDFPECHSSLPTFKSARTPDDRNMTESDTHIAAISSNSDILMGFKFHEGALQQRQVQLPRPLSRTISLKRQPTKIICIADRLVVICNQDIWELNDNKVWAKKGKLPEPIEHDTNVIFTRGAIFFIDIHATFQFDLALEKQKTLPRCLLDEGFCTAPTEEKIFAMGGLRTSEDAVFFRLINHRSEYSPRQGHWENMQQMRCRRVHASASATEKCVYVMGGSYLGQALNSLEFYNEETEGWTLMSSMIIHRSHFEALCCGNKIYAIGGDHNESFEKRRWQSIEVYDINLGNWQIASPGLSLPGQVSACKAPLYLVTDKEIAAQVNEKSEVEATLIIGRRSVMKSLAGNKLTFASNTFALPRKVKVSINSHPENIPAWEPVTSHFTCYTEGMFHEPAELKLLSSVTDLSGGWITVLQKSRNDEWKAVGITKPIGNKLKIKIHASCELIGAVSKMRNTTICPTIRILRRCDTLPIGHQYNDASLDAARYDMQFLSFFANLGKPKGRPPTSEGETTGQEQSDFIKIQHESQEKKSSTAAIYDMQFLSYFANLKKPKGGLLTSKEETTGQEQSNFIDLQRENQGKKSSNENDDSITMEYQQYMEKPAKASKIIGPDGGEIFLHSCALEFSSGAVKEEKEITVSVDNNPENFPPNLEAIAPILGFKPSTKFDEPVLVTMKTWFRALKGQTIPVILSSRKTGYDWKKVGEVAVGDTNEVKFTVKHFCQIGLGIAPENADNGEYVLSNDVYIQRETGQIQSSFYLDSKSEREIWDIMRRRSYAVFSSAAPLQVCGRREQTVGVKANLTAPPNTNLGEGYPSREFQIQDIVRRRQRSIVFVPNPQFGNYDGLVEGEYIAEVDGQEADKTLLARKWPITLDPEDNSTRVNAGVYLSQSRVDTVVADGSPQGAN